VADRAGYVSTSRRPADRLEKSADGARRGNDVFATYRIDEQIKKALDRKVWLPSAAR
jgi:Ribonuclease G/E